MSASAAAHDAPEVIPGSPVRGTPRRVVFAFLDCADGGAQRLTLLACRHLDRQRFEPTLLCARDLGRVARLAGEEGLSTVALGRLRRGWDLAAVPRLAAALRALAADVVHVPLYSRASPYLRAAARRAGVPLVVAHEWSRPEPPRWSRRLADRLLDPGTRYLAASASLRAELLAWGAPPERVEVLRSGIEVAPYRGLDRGAARAALELEPARPWILVPARLHPAKGHRDLLAALPAVLARFPDLGVACAGEGPLAAELLRAAAAAGLGAIVRFLGHREDLPLWLGAADFVVLPSRIEGIPSALLEAMAAGRAVVATDVGGVAEALTDGVEGRLVPARNPAALATAMLDLAAAPERAAAMGERGRARVDREFRVETSTRRLETLYERWLGGA